MPLKYWVYIKKSTLYRTQVVQIGGLIIMARSKGFEPPIFRIGICCVIQLRHERIDTFYTNFINQSSKIRRLSSPG